VFDSAMILLHSIIQVLAGSYSNAMQHRPADFSSVIERAEAA
jgi:hypothetical protein